MSNSIKFKTRFFDLEAEIAHDYEVGRYYDVTLEFGPTKVYWPHAVEPMFKKSDQYGRRFIVQFYLHLHPLSFNFADRDKWRKKEL